MVKPVNRYTSNEFHEWQRTNLSGRFVIQDLDTWPIIISDSEDKYKPIFIVELKRSFSSPEQWNPYKEDLPNYLALFLLAKKSDLPFITIYFRKGETITDESKLAIFEITDVSDKNIEWMKFKKTIMTAKEFKERFPSIF
jgi:hypothetical protein